MPLQPNATLTAALLEDQEQLEYSSGKPDIQEDEFNHRNRTKFTMAPNNNQIMEEPVAIIIEVDDNNINNSNVSEYVTLLEAASNTDDNNNEEIIRQSQFVRQRQSSARAGTRWKNCMNRFWCCCCCYTSPRPLAWTTTTPIVVKLFVPIAIIATHVIFFHGQTANMWKLLRYIQYDISYDVTSYEARTAFDALAIPLHNTFVHNSTETLQNFTYMFAIKELWKAKGMGGVVLPRLASILLVIFSGIWPHLKLFLLTITWFFSNNPIRRKRILNSLSVLGKWSLADVFVVCVMVGVLNVEWDFVASDVAARTKQNLRIVAALIHSAYSTEDICTDALKFSCHHPRNIIHQIQCNTCEGTVNQLMDHPEYTKFVFDGIALQGGGNFRLYVRGLPGIYSFCIAAVSSILLSLLVEWYDDIDRIEQQKRIQQEEAQLLLHHNNTTTEEIENPNTPTVDNERQLSTPLLAGQAYQYNQQQLMIAPYRDVRSQADIEFDRQRLLMEQQNSDQWFSWGITVLSYATAAIVVLGTCFSTMDRNVLGAYPDLMHQVLGVEWILQYSFLDIAQLTGLAGHYDYLLEATFAFFLVIGPIVRAMLCVYAMMYKNTKTNVGSTEFNEIQRYKKRISYIIDFIGAFCAWDVFLAAVVMVDLLMPSITATAITDKRCNEVLHNPICFEVLFNIHIRQFIPFIIVGGTLLLLVSQHIRSKHY